SLVESVCAADLTGLSGKPKLGVHTHVCAVEQRSVSLRRWDERPAGGIGRANADIRNDNAGEKPERRRPKVSLSNVKRSRATRPLRRGRTAYSMGSWLIFEHLAHVRWREGEG